MWPPRFEHQICCLKCPLGGIDYLSYVKIHKSTHNSIEAPLRKAFGVAMALQASSNNDSPRKLAREAITNIEAILGKLPPEASELVWYGVANGSNIRQNRGGPLCEMMIPPRGRLDGSGYFAAVLLKVLVVAYLETKSTHLPLNLKDWQRVAEQDPSNPDLRAAIRGHEQQLSGALTSLFHVTHKEGRSPFTNICRPCIEEIDASRDQAIKLFKRSLVNSLTSNDSDPLSKTVRANALSKLGKALMEKVEFLKKGGRKDG